MHQLDNTEIISFIGKSRTRAAVNHYKRERLQTHAHTPLENESDDTSASEVTHTCTYTHSRTLQSVSATLQPKTIKMCKHTHTHTH